MHCFLNVSQHWVEKSTPICLWIQGIFKLMFFFSYLNHPCGCKFSPCIVAGVGKLNILEWDLVCKSSLVGQSRCWLKLLLHRPQTYLQAPCVAAKASFCSRILCRDPLTAFRSDIVLLSIASTLSCSTQADLAMHWPPSQQICKRDHRGRGLDNHHQTSCLHRAGQTAGNFCRQILPLQQGGGVTIKATNKLRNVKLMNECIDHLTHVRHEKCHFNINSIPIYAHWCEIMAQNHISGGSSTINLGGSRLISTIYDPFIVFEFYFSSATAWNGTRGIAVTGLC